MRIHYKAVQQTSPSAQPSPTDLNSMLRRVQTALQPQAPQSGYFHTFLLPTRRFFNNLSLPIASEKEAHDALTHVFETFCTAAQMSAYEPFSSTDSSSGAPAPAKPAIPRFADQPAVEGTKLDRKRTGRPPFAPYVVTDPALASSFWSRALPSAPNPQPEPVPISALRSEQTDGGLLATKSTPSELIATVSSNSSSASSDEELEPDSETASEQLGTQNADQDSGSTALNVTDDPQGDPNQSVLMRKTRKFLQSLSPVAALSKSSEPSGQQTPDEPQDLDAIGKAADELRGIFDLAVTESLVSNISKRLTNMQESPEEPFLASEKDGVSSASKPSLPPQQTVARDAKSLSSNSLFARLNLFANRSDEAANKSTKGNNDQRDSASTSKSGSNPVSALSLFNFKLLEGTNDTPTSRALAVMRHSGQVYGPYKTRVILFQ